MDQTENFLKNKTIRPTAMRLLIYRFLKNQEKAVSLTDIEAAFEKSERTTLYRTLKTFEEKSIVHKIEDGTGVAKYALCEAGCNCEINSDLHLHFHRTNCNETQCLTEQKIPNINLPPGFKAMEANLMVKGTCNRCNGK
ncbi:Fur family transcriptional regulator [Autumnicola edwardsiae]|uniref:Transcriptional repressor n=1 Tax=Autumnicola edwardsiae TaxID=3075594 RepID=A0ABU3CXW3_9FLAO|nr:transcriptional repressor [Zunongwangia sp. F297]MDT0651213.1 transcriptional repressor [Zunongwangia sp. F297]